MPSELDIIVDERPTVLEIDPTLVAVELQDESEHVILTLEPAEPEMVEIVARGLQGPVGPMGPPGPGGGSAWNFVFDQMNPATVWTIDHNLGGYPSVTVVDSAGTTVEGDVAYIDFNTIVLTFSAPFSGQAFLS